MQMIQDMAQQLEFITRKLMEKERKADDDIIAEEDDEIFTMEDEKLPIEQEEVLFNNAFNSRFSRGDKCIESDDDLSSPLRKKVTLKNQSDMSP